MKQRKQRDGSFVIFPCRRDKGTGDFSQRTRKLEQVGAVSLCPPYLLI